MDLTQTLKEQIKLLLSMQDLDSEVFDKKTRKELIPEKISEINDSIESMKTGMQIADEELKRIQVDKNEKENDLKTAEDRIVKHEGELALIKTNKEYSTMLEQINSLRADVSLDEEKILEFFDAIEKAKSDLSDAKSEFEGQSAGKAKEVKDYKDEIKMIDDRLAVLAEQKNQISKNISKKIMLKYEQILKSRGRHALAEVNGFVCSECRMTLRPQLINEVKLMKEPVLCESCTRILYIID